MKIKGKMALLVTFCITVALGCLVAFGIGENKIFSAENIPQGLDLRGGVDILYEGDKEEITFEEMQAAIALLQNRLDWRGYTEAEVAKEGDRRIRVQIPGVENPEEAIQEIGQTGQLRFLDENDVELLTGDMVANATKQVGALDSTGIAEPYVKLEFNNEGKALFAEATKENIGKIIKIVMDEDVVSSPVVQSAITDGTAIVSGTFTVEEAEEVAAIIRAGSLPFKLNVIQMQNVGAKLGADALSSGIISGVIGISLVMVYMLFSYKALGFVASWALILYIILDLLALSFLEITLTLPGLAGIILSVGMAVDANVIIFERIKEEIHNGRSLRVSIKTGFQRAFSAIVDGNITTLLAGMILFFLGSGTIKGFANTLMIGIVLSMFTAFVITRKILVFVTEAGVHNPKAFGIKVVNAPKKKEEYKEVTPIDAKEEVKEDNKEGGN